MVREREEPRHIAGHLPSLHLKYDSDDRVSSPSPRLLEPARRISKRIPKKRGHSIKTQQLDVENVKGLVFDSHQRLN